MLMRKTDKNHWAVPIWAFLLVTVVSTICGESAYGNTESGATRPEDAKFRIGARSFRQIPFITVRNKTGQGDIKKYFGDERSTESSGYCNVYRTQFTSLQSIGDGAPFHVPDSMVLLDSIEEHSRSRIWRDLRGTANGRRPVLYTHGYYISFARGCKRASLFRDSLELEDRFLLFSWPSDGALLNYTRDESDLYWSVAPLTDVLTDMVEHFGAGKLDIAAHSLGTRGVFLALVQMSGTSHPETPIVDQLVLLAPDIDAGIFEQHLPRIRPLIKRITVYVSANDKPLALSRRVHGHPRLGEPGPHLEGLTGVEIIDLSEVRVRYPSGHVYHLYHRLVIDDLSQLLNDDRSASQRSNLEQIGTNHWLLRP